MRRLKLEPYLNRVTVLASEMQGHVPISLAKATNFRADLAGMLTVTIAASYESCVKEILIEFSARHHSKFSDYVLREYSRLDSKIRTSDLHRYCKSFEPIANARFKKLLTDRKNRIKNNTGQDIETAYHQILDWRHDFAHSAKRNTTIEEAMKFHHFAKHVLFAFHDSFL